MCELLNARAFLLLFLFIFAITAIESPQSLQRNVACDLEQKAYHLRLRCSLAPKSCGSWDQCSINLDLSRGVYGNPYEVADQLPEVKFVITRKAVRENNHLSRLFSRKKNAESESQQEISLNASQVDIEAPSWRAEPTRWKFALDSHRHTWGSSAAIELSIPLHLRYNMPTSTGKPQSGMVSRSLLECRGKQSHIKDHVGFFPSGCSSDLLLVMPLTVILLIVGLVVVLLH